MSYGIVSRHGGTITVESTEGRGTTFRVTFPPAVEPSAVAVRGDSASAGPARSIRCLVVDDEPSVRTVLADVLTAAGHQVVEAADGADAIERIRAEAFDLVLTDLAMPRVSVAGGARRQRMAPGCGVPRHGFRRRAVAEERRANGVDAILVKPSRSRKSSMRGEVARTRPPAGRPEEPDGLPEITIARAANVATVTLNRRRRSTP